jgi:putative Mg2+ transporter-C (MgtC) family protein
MHFSMFDEVSSFWRILREMPDVAVMVDMSVALFLGFLFGYERSYHGRAAGMRTYGLVCMVSAVLVSISVHPDFWLGGHWIANHWFTTTAAISSAIIDPTRTIQGIVTGIGFLGAGIIMKDGMKISGLTTAASIWAVSAIGVLVGLELYWAASIMTLLAELFVMLGAKFDLVLPTRRPIYVSIQFEPGFKPNKEMVRTLVRENGYELARNSVTILSHEGQVEWRFVSVSIDRRRDIGISELASALSEIEGVKNYHISRARN